MFGRAPFLSLFLLLTSVSGCGYHLRGNTREFFDHRGIRTLYVAPIKNDSYKAGVEITVYNALRKRISQGGYVRIVDSPAEADAQISGSIQEAGYSPVALATANSIGPTDPNSTSDPKSGFGPPDVLVGSIYEARLRVRLQLTDHRDKSMWSDELLRTRRFSASTYYGAIGSTSPLINESEFERSLGDLSVSLVTDAEESINTLY